MTTSGVHLIEQMAVGDREAFALFYEHYAPVVFPLILRIVRERADASDVLQEVFWEAWRDAAAYDPRRGSPEAWMVTRARTRAIDRIRTTRRRNAAERAPDPGTIRSARGRLPGAQREVIELAYYAGLTQTEIAERLTQPLGTIKTRIQLGLERLREVVGTSP